jgi:PKD repeat protein
MNPMPSFFCCGSQPRTNGSRPLALLLLLLAVPLAAFGQATYATPYSFTTLAGRPGDSGSADGAPAAAQFANPYNVAVGSNGNVYVADTFNSTIRMVTPTGVVTTLAGLAGSPGSADGTGSAARFYEPFGVAVDTNGNLYVADTVNQTIRKVTATGVVTTLAGSPGMGGSANGTGRAARFNDPEGVAVAMNGDIYVSEYDGHTIRKVTPAGVVTTLAGLAGSIGSANGTGSAARFNQPLGVAVDTNGNLYVADSGNNTIRKVTPAGVVTTLAGLAGTGGSADGTGSAARFNQPFGVAVDTNGNVYVADTSNFTIRKVTPAGVVTTLAGLAGAGGSANGTGSAALFFYPDGVAVDTNGNLYVADGANDEIRKGFFTPFVVQAAASPTNGVAPLTVQFTAASVDSGTNAITNWNWSFGDGSASSLQNPSHAYLAGATFSPSLTATNNLGNAVGGSLPSITVTAPTLQVSVDPNSGTAALTVHFTSASTDSSGHSISHRNWNFGDGSSSPAQNPTHVYNVPGEFYPILAATNSLGVAIVSSPSAVYVATPTLEFTAAPTSGVVPLLVKFASPASDSGGNAIHARAWDFGDGATSSAQNPTHTYQTIGIFSPTLVVTNSHGVVITANGPSIFAQPVPTPPGLVSNGGFETGDFSGWTLADSGIYGYDLVDTFYQSVPEGMEPYTGSYFARMGQSGAPAHLSQTLATTAGAHYLLSFALNSPDGATPNKFSVSWNGTILLSTTNLAAFGPNPALAWTNLQFVVTATGPATVLQFAIQDDPTALGLDDVSVLPAQPQLLGLSVSGANLVATGSNGLSGQVYHLLASTNLALPLDQWTVVASNMPDTSGNFSLTVTNAANSGIPETFYVIRLQ